MVESIDIDNLLFLLDLKIMVFSDSKTDYTLFADSCFSPEAGSSDEFFETKFV